MNILPFVIVLLTILASLSYGFLDKGKVLYYEKELALSYMKVERKLLKELHRNAFKKAPHKKQADTQTLSPKSPSEPPEESDPLTSPRSSALTKMNIFPLFKEECPPELYLIAENLFFALYEHSPFLKQSSGRDSLKHLFKNIIALGKHSLKEKKREENAPLEMTLFQLYPQEPSQHAVFYKILRGTHLYNLEQSQGYPPLQDFFFIKEETSRPILHFPSLSPKMLEIVFGKEEADCILSKEIEMRTQHPKRHLKTLSKEELLSLLHEKFPSKLHFDKLIEYLSFGQDPTNEEKITVMDEKTCITLSTKKIL
jgi:hypothetical protein